MKKLIKSLGLCILLFYCSNVLGQKFDKGLWAGTINEEGLIYDYTIQINSIVGNQVKGTSISKNSKFYCSTDFSGEINDKQIRITESKVINTNFKNKNEICLMTLNLLLKNGLLKGNFTSTNNIKKKCGAGTVSLSFIRVDSVVTNYSIEKNILNGNIPIEIIKAVDTLKLNRTSPFVSENKNLRNVEITNVLNIPFDSVHIEVYDNGIIDGDQVTLLVNKEVVVKNKIISDRPIEFDLLKKNGSEFIIEFFAESLGNISPNTGLIIIKHNMYRKELTFASDFLKTNAIKIILNH
jgi:hypothetical protein